MRSTNRLWLLLAAAALAVGACGGGSATPPSGSVPRSGGTLTVAIPSDLTLADPALVADASSMFIANQVVEGLVGLKPGTTSDIVPVLAASMPTVSADGLTYTFKLRTGIRFHDGTDFNATAVKANYDRWSAFAKGDLQGHATYYSAVFGGFGVASNLTSVDAPDGTTVVFHLKAPQSNFLISQTAPAFGIQSPTAIEKNGGNEATLSGNAYAQGAGGQGKAMVGTGPFMFSEWKSGESVTLVRNPSYWNTAGQAYLDKIVFKAMTDASARTSALESGSVDLVESLDPTAVAALKGSAAARALSRVSSGQTAQIFINSENTYNGKANPLANKVVRFAVAAAVQKQAYSSAFYAGGAVAADNWQPAGSLFYKREYLPAYDVTKARSYVAQSGLSASQLTLELAYPTDSASAMLPDAKGLAQAIAQDLQTVGFTVTFKPENSAAYTSDQAAGKLQMWVSGWACRWAAADEFLSTGLFHYVSGAPSVEFNYTNDELDKTMTAAAIAPDQATALAGWQKAQDLIASDMPTVPLLDVMPPAGARSYVVGFVGSGLQLEDLNSVWLNK